LPSNEISDFSRFPFDLDAF